MIHPILDKLDIASNKNSYDVLIEYSENNVYRNWFCSRDF